jgi:multidrug efflux pump subunit AcrB
LNLTEFSLKNPYTVLSLTLVVVALGIFAFLRTPTDLFPNTVPPQVVVVTVAPGAAARDISDMITEIIEKELNTISGLKKIVSTSRDDVSSVNAEFDYSKPIGEAVLDVQNAMSRIRSELPAEIQEPRIYRITDAKRPLLTLSLSPKPGSAKILSEIRLLAENQIQDVILRLPGIADVDIFGANHPEVKVRVSRDRLAALDISIGEVIAALSRQNISSPVGTVYSGNNEFLVRTTGEFKNIQDISSLPIRHKENGYIRIADIAEVFLGESEQRSIYHGNGKAAIAVNVLRPENGPTVSAIKSVKSMLPRLKAEYPDIDFSITDDQQPIIDINVQGMRVSLIQAVILTIFIIFFFLGDTRAAMVVSVSIPLAFLMSLVVLWFSPYTLNMVTLSGLIISVGLVVDSSVVILENIYRHYQAMKENPDAEKAAREGAVEVSLAVTAGMLTTVIVMVPVMFAGGYTQQVMRPLNLMISSTLVASLIVALTVIPLTAAKLLGRPRKKKNFMARFFGYTDKGVKRLADFYTAILDRALVHRLFTLILAIGFFAVTMKIVKPLNGGELMPPMDTGIVIVAFDTPSDYSPALVENVLTRVEQMIFLQEGVEKVSSIVGSEPGQISFGGGGATSQSARVTVYLVDRKSRNETIWEIEDTWRKGLRKISDIRSFRVSEYGATPLSTTKAPVDIIISGPDTGVISRLADQCMTALKGLPGVIDLRRSWYTDKVEHDVVFDPALTSLYQTTPADATRELKAAVKGIPATQMRLDGYLDIPVNVRYADADIDNPDKIGQAYVPTRFGPIPLRSMADITEKYDQPFLTRERMENTIDITGGNHTYTIAQVGKMIMTRLAKIKTPQGYQIDVAGSFVDMAKGQQEMGKALIVGIVLLYFLLLAMFKSFGHPITIMAAIPLAVAGAMWGLLLFDKPMCKPATMGLILLGGTIVNNSILLLDFIISARKRGTAKNEAIRQSVRLRIRPILMTTTSTIIGLTPLIFEMAVGLERMSPLGIAAATGLLAGSFLTMVVIPVIYSLLDSMEEGVHNFFRFAQKLNAKG